MLNAILIRRWSLVCGVLLLLGAGSFRAAAVERKAVDDAFKKQVLDASKGRLLAAVFTRKSCSKCPPALKRLDNASKIWTYKDKFAVQDIDIETNKNSYLHFFQDLKTGRTLESTPTVMFFYNGEQLGDDLGNPDNQILLEELDKRLLMIEELKKGAARAQVEKKYRRKTG